MGPLCFGKGCCGNITPQSLPPIQFKLRDQQKNGTDTKRNQSWAGWQRNPSTQFKSKKNTLITQSNRDTVN